MFWGNQITNLWLPYVCMSEIKQIDHRSECEIKQIFVKQTHWASYWRNWEMLFMNLDLCWSLILSMHLPGSFCLLWWYKLLEIALWSTGLQRMRTGTKHLSYSSFVSEKGIGRDCLAWHLSLAWNAGDWSLVCHSVSLFWRMTQNGEGVNTKKMTYI